MISVIVPVYNVEPYLKKCIDSILNQTYHDFEVILIDDGSKDGSGMICDKYAIKDDRVRVFHTENRGLSAARNRGLIEARGDTVCFVDSDDWIEPNFLQEMWMKMNEMAADVCICGYSLENATTQKDIHFEREYYTGNDALRALIKGRINTHAWNKLYRRAVFCNSLHNDGNISRNTDNMLLFPEGKNFEDYYIMHKILSNAREVIVLEESLYHYRIRMDSITKNYSAKNLIDYADAHFARYSFLRNDKSSLNQFSESEVMAEAAKGLSKVWRWWHGCSHEEKIENHERLKEMEGFIRNDCPLFGYKTWPRYLRISSFFMHSRSKASLFALYYINISYRRLRPNKANNMHL
ncbi:MAG: glycosyltransferase family 2 protein [Clostridiales bacterium]|nr:glycosyltransferase family 2 protein [Clostridiales bacterium]